MTADLAYLVLAAAIIFSVWHWHTLILAALDKAVADLKAHVVAEVAKVLHPTASAPAPASSVTHTVTINTPAPTGVATTAATPATTAMAAANQQKIYAALAQPLDTSKVDVAELGKILSNLNGQSTLDMATGAISPNPPATVCDATQLIEQKVILGTPISAAELAFASGRLSDFRTSTNADGSISAVYAPLPKVTTA